MSDNELLQKYGWSLNENVSPFNTSSDVASRISVGILSYNRCEDLRRGLNLLFHYLSHATPHVIVVDNNSSDDTVAMLRSDFPDVQLFIQTTNRGTAARNVFIDACTTEYLLCLDDDSVPGTPHSIADIVAFMDAHPELSIVSTRCIQPRTGIDETADFGIMGHHVHDHGEGYYRGLYLFECACCMRVADIRAVGGYDNRNLWGAEGVDLMLSLYANNYIMAWHPHLLTLHFKQLLNRPKESGSVWAVQYRMAVFAKHFPLYALIPILTLYTLRRVIEILLHPDRTRGIWEGYRCGIKNVFSFRKKHPKLSFSKVRGLMRWYSGIARW